jgi:hypothetical protein
MGFNDKQQHLLLENEKSLYALVSTHKEIYYLAELYEFLALSPHLLFSSPPWLMGMLYPRELGWHALLRS